MVAIEVAIVLALILLNGFFAMSEMAIVSARRGRLQQMALEDNGARLALELAGEPGKFLSAVQIGITLIGILAGAFSGATLADKLGDYLDRFPILASYGDVAGIVIVVMAITFASLILGELVPKRIALANAEAIAARVARPLIFVAMMAAPVVYVLRVASETILRLMRITLKPRAGVTEEEVKTLIAEGTQSGVFDKTEQRMIQGVLGLADQSIRAIMTPRPEVVWLDIDDSPEDIRTVIAGTSFSRLLVSRGSVDELVGIVQKKDLVAACLAGRALDIAASVRKPLVVPGTVTILQMLEMFKTTSIHLAVAVNEYGSVQGVITLTDIVKAIAGDIPEHAGAVVPDYTTRDDGSYLMDGAMPIALARDVLRLSETPGDSPYYTLAGLTMAGLGRVPREGDRFDWEAWTFEVVDMDGNRIDKLLVSPRKPS